MTKTMTLAEAKPGTVVELISNGIMGPCATGRIVRMHGPTEGTTMDPEHNRFYVWQAFQQGKTVIHGSNLCRIATHVEDVRF